MLERRLVTRHTLLQMSQDAALTELTSIAVSHLTASCCTALSRGLSCRMPPQVAHLTFRAPHDTCPLFCCPGTSWPELAHRKRPATSAHRGRRVRGSHLAPESSVPCRRVYRALLSVLRCREGFHPLSTDENVEHACDPDECQITPRPPPPDSSICTGAGPWLHRALSNADSTSSDAAHLFAPDGACRTAVLDPVLLHRVV